MRRLLHRLIAIFAAALVVAAPAAAVEHGYVLGADDTITVQVYGQPDAGVTTRIKADGTIVMPLIGTIKAEGLTQLSSPTGSRPSSSRAASSRHRSSTSKSGPT